MFPEQSGASGIEVLSCRSMSEFFFPPLCVVAILRSFVNWDTSQIRVFWLPQFHGQIEQRELKIVALHFSYGSLVMVHWMTKKKVGNIAKVK